MEPQLQNPEEQPNYSASGVDLTLIRWMLSLTPAERLQMLQDTHGAPVTTFDIDIVHRRIHDNVERLMKALESLDAYYRHEPERLLRPTGTSSAPQPHRDVLAQPQSIVRKQNNTWLASFQLAWKRSCGELRSALRGDSTFHT